MATPSQAQPDPSRVAADVLSLRRALSPDIRAYRAGGHRGPYLVILSGLPGTGKSYFANFLSRRLSFVTVGSDRMRKTLVPQPRYKRSEHIRVFAACHRLIEELLTEEYRVIFDATNLTEGFRRPVYELSARAGSPYCVVGFTAPGSLVRERLRRRSDGLFPDDYSDADWRVYGRLRPGQEPIQHTHIQADSSADIVPVVDQVLRMVKVACPGQGT